MNDIAKMIAIAKKFGGGSGGPSEVVILSETELVYTEEYGQPAFVTTIQEQPKGFTLVKVVYNGAPYDCIVAAQPGATLFGNAGYMNGMDNGKPFLAMTTPSPDGNFILLCVPMDGAQSVTMSITQVESKDAGAFVISVECDSEKDGQYYANATMDKTIDEIDVAYGLGYALICRLSINAMGGRQELLLMEYTHNEGYTFAPPGDNSYVTNVVVYLDGVIEVH